MCWADFTPRFSPTIDIFVTYDVAGVAITRGGRDECIDGCIMAIRDDEEGERMEKSSLNDFSLGP